MTWTNVEIGGKRAAFCDSGEIRLYVCERFGATEAWAGSDKVGNFDNIEAAKAAAERKVGLRLPEPVVKATPKKRPSLPSISQDDIERQIERQIERENAQREAVIATPPVAKPKLNSFKYVAERAPVADLIGESLAPTEVKSASVEAPVAAGPAAPIDGHCKCGAKLGRSGKCPALCEPVPEPPPKYTGPERIGFTHIGRLAAPVTW